MKSSRAAIGNIIPMGIRLSESLETFKNIYKRYIHDTDMEWNNYE